MKLQVVSDFPKLRLDDQKAIIFKIINSRSKKISEHERMLHADSLVATTKGYFQKVLSNYFMKEVASYYERKDSRKTA